ncbi:hypothetical protein V6N13_044242 [Hibiscus sabdariffa]|uniref:Uncharacterized protein n=1 Tax=Hibiscus sabdariffa TaxID=183260 RepID=A0ABR2RHM5_9ROSI
MLDSISEEHFEEMGCFGGKGLAMAMAMAMPIRIHDQLMDCSAGKSENPVEHKNDAPNLPERGLHIGLQSGATESQSASSLIPPASNFPFNDTGPDFNVEALNASESVFATFTATFPATETVNLNPQVQDGAICSDLKSWVRMDLQLKNLFDGFHEQFGSGPGSRTCLMKVEDISSTFIKPLFKASAAIYRTGPWRRLHP